MKKFIVLSILVVIIAPLSAENIKNINENYYLSRLSNLLDHYEMFMETNGNQESGYFKAFSLFKEKLINKETIFTLDLKNDNLINGGAQFHFNHESGVYYISIGYKLVDVFDNYPTLVYSIITHEVWHAYAYLTNPEGFIMIDSDPFEKEMYEFDAIINEAIFIDEVVLKSDFISTSFENFLRDCYINNNITDFTSPLMKIDYYTLNELYILRNEYKTNKNKNYLDKRLNEIGLNLLKYYEESLKSENLWFKYKILIALNTYNHYSTILFRQTVAHEKLDQKWEDIFIEFPNFHTLYYNFGDILGGNIDYLNTRHNEYIEHFNNNLL